MRKTALALLMLLALLTCCLIAGTPVNNDVSREATTAGIHLTAPPTAARAAATAAAPLLSILAVLLLLVTARRSDETAADLVQTDEARRSLLRARSGSRRGPPALAF